MTSYTPVIKILYAVNGDGLGHATRSIPIIRALSKKYRVKTIVGSKRSYEIMHKYVKNIEQFEGLRFSYGNNKVRLYDTISKNAKILFSKSSNFKQVYNTIRKYSPDVILTDCDYLTITVAKLFNIPIICVCNIHSLTEMKYSVPRRYYKSYYAAKTLTKIFTSNVDYHVITTFFYLPVRNRNAFLFPPILRDEILTITPQRKDYFLVYQTTGMSSISSNNRLIKILKAANARFVVYGFEKDEVQGNITFRKTNTKQFFKDFKDCKACIANGGYTFISEAISLRKPVLCIPIRGTFEQALNAIQIKRLGYGDMCDVITIKKLKSFIRNNDKYYHRLTTLNKHNNSAVIKKIEELIAAAREN